MSLFFSWCSVVLPTNELLNIQAILYFSSYKQCYNECFYIFLSVYEFKKGNYSVEVNGQFHIVSSYPIKVCTNI